MTDIELFIKIPEEEYRWIKKSDKNSFADVASKECMLHAIRNGTPLPEGHGRVVDESKIKNCGWDFVNHHAKTDAPTIIEADTESER